MNKHSTFHNKSRLNLRVWFSSIILSLLLTACGGDSNSGSGFIQLYNISSNAPEIFLTVDQYSDDNFNAQIYSGINYTNVSSRISLEADTYDIELAWQDQYNDKYDLELIYSTQIKIVDEVNKFIVVAEDIKAPVVVTYDIAVRDDNEKDDDIDDELFNIRFVNLHALSEGVDIYISQSDETFNQANLIDNASYKEMTPNIKVDQGDYIIYLTLSGSTDIIYQSNEIAFPYASEYILVLRENTGAGSSPFVLDKISTSSITSFPHTNSEAEFRIYNGIIEHELLPQYQNTLDLHIAEIDDTPEISSLAFGEYSETILIDSGDYSMSLMAPEQNVEIIKNHLLALSENSDKTVFFYLIEDNVDEDGDGDVDENGDGYVDEIEITINSLVVDNSQSESIYNHQINTINLIDHDDFTSVKVYFVRNDETIESADQSLSSSFVKPQSIYLLNNTYNVFVIGILNSSDIILAHEEVTFTEESKDQFLVLEQDINSSTGFKMTFSVQNNN